jgi:hypothetical protein
VIKQSIGCFADARLSFSCSDYFFWMVVMRMEACDFSSAQLYAGAMLKTQSTTHRSRRVMLHSKNGGDDRRSQIVDSIFAG